MNLTAQDDFQQIQLDHAAQASRSLTRVETERRMRSHTLNWQRTLARLSKLRTPLQAVAAALSE